MCIMFPVGNLRKDEKMKPYMFHEFKMLLRNNFPASLKIYYKYCYY